MMKKLFGFIAIMLLCSAAQAGTTTPPSLTITNATGGTAYIKVYTVTISTCTLLPEYIDIVVPGASSVVVNLANTANWNGGAIPVNYDFVYAEVSRDPSCPSTVTAWGAWAGVCGAGNAYWDMVTVGNAACGYSPQDCFENTSWVANCNGFAAGSVMEVDYNVAGPAVTIILP